MLRNGSIQSYTIKYTSIKCVKYKNNININKTLNVY